MKNMIIRLYVFFASMTASYKRILMGLSVMAFSGHAAALTISDLTAFWRSEAAAIVPVILFIIAGIGIIIGGVAVISGILAKKNNQPLSWQVGGVIGGSLAVIIPVIILAFSGTLGSGEGNAQGTFRDLGINY